MSDGYFGTGRKFDQNFGTQPLLGRKGKCRNIEGYEFVRNKSPMMPFGTKEYESK
jgi:hypothetical protein